MIKRAFAVALAVAALAVTLYVVGDSDSENEGASVADPVARACALPKSQLLRIWRGFDPERSEDIIIVPKEPNYIGSFAVTSHTGPWDYVQQVPLVLYGPGFIRANGQIADVDACIPPSQRLWIPTFRVVPVRRSKTLWIRPPKAFLRLLW
jgi:hypothetical protein